MREFLLALTFKSNHHRAVWVYLLANERKVISLRYLSDLYDIPRTTIRNIIAWGLEELSKGKLNSTIESTQNGIVFRFVKEGEKAKEVKVEDSRIIEIIDYLNEKTNRKYSPNTKQTTKDIKARLKDGFSVADFKKVIDVKCGQWMGTEYELYLRPITLFGNKFHDYIHEKNEQRVSQIQQTIRVATDTAQSIDWGMDTQQ